MSRTKRGLPTEPQPRRSAAAKLVDAPEREGQRHPRSDTDVKPKSRTTRRITLDLEAAVVDELKDAVVYLQHNGHPEATQVSITAHGIQDSLHRDVRLAGQIG